MRREKRQIIINATIVFGMLAFLAIGVFVSTINHDRQYEMVAILKTNQEIDFWTQVRNGMNMGADIYDVNLSILGTETETDFEGQIQLIEDAIKQRPDAIIVAAQDYSLMTEVLKKAKKEGILLILIDSIVDEDIADAVVATDNVMAGRKLGIYASELIGEGDKIGIMGHVEGTSTAIEREQGVREGLGIDNENVVDIQFCDSFYSVAEELTKEMIEKNPDIKLIIGLNENAAVGAGWAIEDLHLGNEVQLVGIDSSMASIRYMEEGIFDGIVIQKSFNMGFLSIEQAVGLLMGDSVEGNIDSGSLVITKDNLYDDENQKVLFPFDENSDN